MPVTQHSCRISFTIAAHHAETPTMTKAELNEAEASMRHLQEAVAAGLPDEVIFERLHMGLTDTVGFKVLTVLKLDSSTLRSVRLYSSEKSYPIGGRKQHVRSAWSEAVLDRHSVFVARDLAELRATFPDSAAIEATGCGSIIAVPILWRDALVGTMNLWHREGFYDLVKAERALPFATAISALCAR
jgi:transcriptional regulator with GAF, ATPase, and Fis domain